MTIWARLYEHPDARGRSAYADLNHGSPGRAYGLFYKTWFESVDLREEVSSVRTGASDWEDGGWLYLFEHNRFLGRWARVPCVPGDTTNVPSLRTRGMNDRAQSALLIRSFDSEMPPIALGSFGRPSVRDTIAAMVTGIPLVTLRADPIITWHPWPDFHSSRKFVLVRIPIRVDVPRWRDYDAEIRLWIYLYIDRTGTIRGFVNFYGAEVGGGVLSGKILDQIMAAIGAQVAAINALLQNALSPMQRLSFERFYYLPGRGIGATGHTSDDVSIVLVKPR